jgi:MftR C-terminal domain
MPGASLQAHARASAVALMAVTPQSESDAEFQRQMQSYIAADPELRAIQAEQQTALIDAIAEGLRAELGGRLTIPPRTLSLAIQALIRGYLGQWAQTPNEVTEDAVAVGFEALLVGATTAR